MSSEPQSNTEKQRRVNDEECERKNTSSSKTDITNTTEFNSDVKMIVRSSTLKSPKSRRQPPSSLLVTGTSSSVSNSSNNYLTPSSYLTVETGTKSKNKSQYSLKKNKSPSSKNYNTIKKSKSKSESDAYNNSKTPSTQSLDSSSSKSREHVSDDVFEGSFGVTCTPTSHSTPSHTKTSGNDSRKTSRSKETPKTPRKSPKPFEQYLPLEEVQRGLKKGELIEGVLRINPKNFEDSYISAPDGQMDIYIGGILDRNRALNGDLVAVQLHPQNRWKILYDNVRDYESRFPSSFSNCEGLCSLTKGTRPKSTSLCLSQESPNISPMKTSKKKHKKKKSSDCIAGDGKGCSPENEIKCEDGENCHSSTTNEGKKNCKKKNKNKRKKKKNLKNNDSLLYIPQREFFDNNEILQLSENFQSVDIINDNIWMEEKTITVMDECIINQIDPLNSVDNSQVVAPHELSETEEVDSANEQLSVCSNEVDQQIEMIDFLEHSSANHSTEFDEKICYEDVNAVREKDENITEKPLSIPYEKLDAWINTTILDRSNIKLLSDNNLPICVDSQDRDALNSDSTENTTGNILSVQMLLQHPKANRFVQKTGKVVCIIEHKHSRMAVGSLKLMQDKNKDWALFAPQDHRIPRIMVPMLDCPEGFYQRPQDFSKMIFIGRLTEWENTGLARGRIYRNLGKAGEIVPETEGLLLQNNVDFTEFPDNLLDDLSLSQPWTIPESEFSYRKDLREKCIFTIDPVTARDLDDAVSCEMLPDGNYEIGVHIADVSFFIKENSPLDQVAASRGTSVYLVHMVVPMLPRLLCESLCSLNPSEDRLCMSVIWQMTEEGDILSEWFGRTIINSCAKLSYNHAQIMIEEPNKIWSPEEHPPISGNFSLNDVTLRVQQLHKISSNLRKRRFQNGALRLDQITLYFTLNDENSFPTGVAPYILKDSNRLIEEYMLLANMAVAHKILSAFPKTALLRCHEPPVSTMMDEVVETCAKVGLHIDTLTSKSIQDCLNQLNTKDPMESAYFAVLTHLLSKPMKRAKYFCSGSVEDETLYHHYALCVPLYTHFTSPIRRYPDILVHRSLAAALDYTPETSLSVKRIQQIAEHCNDKKYVAKLVQEYSQEMFLAIFIKECGSREELGIVIAVLDHSFDVLILHLGIIKRVYCNQLPLKDINFQRDQGIGKLTLIWNSDEDHNEMVQVITIFSLVQVILVPGNEPLKINALLKQP